jgi:hypothetical protein
VVERSALVGFKVTPRDVPEFRGINQFGHGFAQVGKHALESGVEEQRLLVAHEEMIELHVKVRNVNGESEKIGSDFIDGSHGIRLARPNEYAN